MLRLRGAESFRCRLVCATLSGRSIRIDGIREDDERPGLRDYEASFLRLLEKLTNGCTVEINETGTTLRYRPGILLGGSDLEHDCGTSRPVGWFLEPLLLLGLFGRQPLGITLRGITNGGTADPGVDVVRQCTLPLLKRALGLEKGEGELRVLARGCAPRGGGAVALSVPSLKDLAPPVTMLDEGMVKRVRGVSYSARVPPQATGRLADGARGPLNKLLADVFVFTDHASGDKAGLSPGYGITLVAETTTGRLLSAETNSGTGLGSGLEGGIDGGAGADRGDDADGDEARAGTGVRAGAKPPTAPTPPRKGRRAATDQTTPEEIGEAASALLLEEISRGGVVDSAHQPFLLTLCALGPAEISQVRTGPLTRPAVGALRAIRDVLGVRFAMKPERESQTIFVSCVGAGIKSLSRKIA